MCTPAAVDRRLHDVMHAHHTTMRQYFQSHGLFNGQPVMLFEIQQSPGITQKELADRMNITPASVAVSIRRMEAEGLVLRRRDARDARLQRLTLTSKGESLDKACRQARDIIIDVLYEDFSPEELAGMDRMLRHMQQKIDKARQLFPRRLGQEDLHED